MDNPNCITLVRRFETPRFIHTVFCSNLFWIVFCQAMSARQAFEHNMKRLVFDVLPDLKLLNNHALLSLLRQVLECISAGMCANNALFLMSNVGNRALFTLRPPVDFTHLVVMSNQLV
ncbi:hypothetical protein AVEN_165887-1 [Araneus ventricosus]|uniref:Uncharacterized protein n=1 Tax=Araneus ventricosus TaxID=182803 RepID=A0A4Y2J9J8_ARAVE|nr:hypothetical protein AVEN_165887-1 [Araneus ventricosus]